MNLLDFHFYWPAALQTIVKKDHLIPLLKALILTAWTTEGNKERNNTLTVSKIVEKMSIQVKNLSFTRLVVIDMLTIVVKCPFSFTWSTSSFVITLFPY